MGSGLAEGEGKNYKRLSIVGGSSPPSPGLSRKKTGYDKTALKISLGKMKTGRSPKDKTDQPKDKNNKDLKNLVDPNIVVYRVPDRPEYEYNDGIDEFAIEKQRLRIQKI